MAAKNVAFLKEYTDHKRNAHLVIMVRRDYRTAVARSVITQDHQ